MLPACGRCVRWGVYVCNCYLLTTIRLWVYNTSVLRKCMSIKHLCPEAWLESPFILSFRIRVLAGLSQGLVGESLHSEPLDEPVAVPCSQGSVVNLYGEQLNLRSRVCISLRPQYIRVKAPCLEVLGSVGAVPIPAFLVNLLLITQYDGLCLECELCD